MVKQYRSLLGSFKRQLKRMGSVRWSVGCNVTIQSGSVDRPAAPGSTEKQAVGRDRTACFSCGEKVARYKRSRVGFRTGESATRFTHGPEESDFDVFLVSGLRNAQVLYVPTYNRQLTTLSLLLFDRCAPFYPLPSSSPYCPVQSNRVEFVLTPMSPRETRNSADPFTPTRSFLLRVPYVFLTVYSSYM